MALHECPWMVARCPHYSRTDCEDEASKNCLLVKNTTRMAITAIAALKQQPMGMGPDSVEDREIADAEQFLQDSMRKRGIG